MSDLWSVGRKVPHEWFPPPNQVFTRFFLWSKGQNKLNKQNELRRAIATAICSPALPVTVAVPLPPMGGLRGGLRQTICRPSSSATAHDKDGGYLTVSAGFISGAGIVMTLSPGISLPLLTTKLLVWTLLILYSACIEIVDRGSSGVGVLTTGMLLYLWALCEEVFACSKRK